MDRAVSFDKNGHQPNSRSVRWGLGGSDLLRATGRRRGWQRSTTQREGALPRHSPQSEKG